MGEALKIQSVFKVFIPPPAGWIIILLILAIAAWVGWSLWSEFQRLRKERTKVLEAARRKIREVEELDDPIDEIKQFAESSELKDTLVARAIRTVLALRESRNPDMEATLTMLDYSEASRLNLARSAPNWLLLLGIAGTVLGLANAVVPLAPQIQAAVGEVNPSVASQSMAQTLEAMRHAFACSLWGILIAVIISLFTRKIVSDQQRTVAEIQELVLNEVASILLPKSEAVQLENIQRTIKSGRQFLQQTNEQIERVTQLMQSAAEQFNQVLATTVQRMEQIGNDLRTSAEDIGQTLLQSTQSVQDSTSRLTESAEKLKESSDQLMSRHNDISNAYAELLRLYNKSKQDLEDTIQRQIEHIGLYRQEIEQLSNRVVDRLLTISADLAKTNTSYNEARDSVLQSAGEIRNTIQAAFDRLQGELSGIIGEYRRQMTDVENRLREMVGTLSGVKDSLEQLPEALRGIPIDEVETRLRAMIGSLSGIQTALEQFQGVLRGTEMSGVESRLQEVVHRLSHIQTTIVELLQEVKNQQGATASVWRNANRTELSSDGAVSGVSEELAQIREILKQIHDQIQARGSSLGRTLSRLTRVLTLPMRIFSRKGG
jgi:DNA repair exonuclease SbcCD ATPase subunit